MTSYDTARPYAASYVIFRRDGKVACLLRSNTSWMDNHYGLVAGKVEKGESFTQAAVREAAEEAGVKVRPADLKQVFVMHRKEPDGMEWVDTFFEVRSWEGEIHNAEPQVHSELTWLDPMAMPPNTIPVIKIVLEYIEKGRLYLEFGWD